MRGLEVQLNGKKLCTAGIDQAGVLNAMVDVVWRKPKAEYAMHLRVGGMQGDQHLRWAAAELAVGDEISVRIVEAPTIDTPSPVEPPSLDQSGKMKL
jgi:hypothetical protein